MRSSSQWVCHTVLEAGCKLLPLVGAEVLASGWAGLPQGSATTGLGMTWVEKEGVLGSASDSSVSA